jgi:hypothetical protein
VIRVDNISTAIMMFLYIATRRNVVCNCFYQFAFFKEILSCARVLFTLMCLKERTFMLTISFHMKKWVYTTRS